MGRHEDMLVTASPLPPICALWQHHFPNWLWQLANKKAVYRAPGPGPGARRGSAPGRRARLTPRSSGLMRAMVVARAVRRPARRARAVHTVCMGMHAY
eukprot:SAG31_NODE_20_length_34168_cov_33.651296_28_plen_98_part_00